MGGKEAGVLLLNIIFFQRVVDLELLLGMISVLVFLNKLQLFLHPFGIPCLKSFHVLLNPDSLEVLSRFEEPMWTTGLQLVVNHRFHLLLDFCSGRGMWSCT